MTQAKRPFEDLLGGAPTVGRIPGNTRDEMRRWFDDQPPYDQIAGRLPHDGAAARLQVRAVAAQPRRSASTVTSHPLFDQQD